MPVISSSNFLLGDFPLVYVLLSVIALKIPRWDLISFIVSYSNFALTLEPEKERESGDPLETGFEVKLAIGSLMRYCPVNREKKTVGKIAAHVRSFVGGYHFGSMSCHQFGTSSLGMSLAYNLFLGS